MKKFFKEFREFIARGNVLDMAIGVIIATAFGKITTTLVNNVFMPFISWLFGAQDMSALNIVARPEVKEMVDGVEVVTQNAIIIGFGDLVSAIINFVLIAFVVFLIVKTINKAKAMAEKKKAEEVAEEAPAEPAPSKEELLLTEIRDLLKEKN